MAEESNAKTIDHGEAAKESGTEAKANNKTVKLASKKSAKKRSAKKGAVAKGKFGSYAFPIHSISKSLRIPRAILEQNAGKECSPQQAAKFAGLGFNGEIAVEISSATKYGLLERPNPGSIKPTELVRRIVRPQTPTDRLNAIRSVVLNTPVISDVYKNYRGENLPDQQFFFNTITDNFKVPVDKAAVFETVFRDALTEASLIDRVGDKERVLDVTHGLPDENADSATHLKKISRGVAVLPTDTCFVMQPFAGALGSYYSNVYEPAIRKAGLSPVRADADIFGTGKIIDQIWNGIRSSKILVAELTSRNPNVFYELGLAHALRKPVVLISSNEEDVPFDIRHVRVIYYDTSDPFWGTKLIDKVAENIISALKDPKDATLFDL